MREIKFRAWIVDEKARNFSVGPAWLGNQRMVYDYFMCNNEGQEIYGVGDCHHIELMQFTGLVTRDNIDIYEGDVIDCRDGRFIIEYEDSFARFIMTNKKLIRNFSQDEYKQEADMCMRSIRVIGNIYENPELLK